MPTYNVTVSTQFDLEIEANSPEEAIASIESVPNENNDISTMSILAIEEILPPPTINTYNGYVSLRDFHEQQTANQTNGYTAFISSRNPSSDYTRLTPFTR
jgi:hypothetical protein